jgi:pyruvate,water dikinase
MYCYLHKKTGSCLLYTFLFIFWLLQGCVDVKQETQPPEPVFICHYSNPDSLPYIDSITCPDEFEAFSGELLQQTYGNVASIKVVYEISSGRIFYVSSGKYPLHYDFCREVLKCPLDQVLFNQYEYGSDSVRQYYLGAVNHYLCSDLYTLELFTSDKMPADGIKTLFEKVTQTAYFGNVIHFMPTSNAMAQRISTISSQLRAITQDDVFKDQTYQPLNRTASYGYLKKIDISDIGSSYINRHDIVVVNGLPNDIPVLAGIITTEFQTPLSHVNVLSHNRGTPNMALKSAWNDSVINAHLNKLVYFSVQLDSFEIRDASIDEAQEFWNKNEPQTPVAMNCNDSTPGLCDMSNLSYKSTPVVGAKAANFAELAKLFNSDSVSVPEGAFAIPFYYYRKHAIKSGVDSLLRILSEDSLAKIDISRKSQMLEKIRNQLLLTPLDTNLVSEVKSKIQSLTNYTKIRFRSSTNAEDLKGFNGAGLYESYSADLNDPKHSVDKAIKQVYASMWTLEGYEEREYFKIDQNSVAMGILVHRSFPQERANGVAITTNIFNRLIPAFTINVQSNDISVVNPPPGYTADLLLYYVFEPDAFTNPLIETITRSNITGGASVLSDKEIVLLAKSLDLIKNHYFYDLQIDQGAWYYDFAMDVEFKFDGPERKLYIKQARPY